MQAKPNSTDTAIHHSTAKIPLCIREGLIRRCLEILYSAFKPYLGEFHSAKTGKLTVQIVKPPSCKCIDQMRAGGFVYNFLDDGLVLGLLAV
jgi:hypothetical protein